MSSGYGLSGGQSRCFPFWQEVLACYVVNTSADDDSGKKKCAPILEDYYECLHHKKEVGTDQERPPRAGYRPTLHNKVRALQTAYRKSEAAALSTRDAAPPAGAIRNLGLLDKDEDTKAVIGK
ncbi:NADH dehydrogenase [ubiquinone] iron-sulfur protein 5-B [Lachnellula suecica]|uniref:NADH dehydrogenase [ubiquinone] iron-sulfur protein 5 n=1 Tax=Lachnellula suecica TaxID=602035 RepID=A0A8T9C9Q5_9HELO|nr:NADH dehydrogenase [ubiquinone] iron-sulfur protein 5-B [Lachnellula suecica]